MDFADRLRQQRKFLNLTQAQLAKKAGMTQQMIQQLETRKVLTTGRMVTLATALGVRPEWLAAGQSPMTAKEAANVAPGPPIRGKVPLISWVSAGVWREAIDPLEPGDAEAWIETTSPVMRHTFALRVQGDSMEPDFPAGVLIVVEPDLDPQPGDYVIAKNGDEATFKQLVKDGADWYLKPLNPRYPIKPLESPCKIIGVVREAVRRFR